MAITKYQARIIYLLAKAGEPLRKQNISQATSRWTAEIRDFALIELHSKELIEVQTTPRMGNDKPASIYWLTEAGIEQAEKLHDAKIIKLPEGWRQYGDGKRQRVL